MHSLSANFNFDIVAEFIRFMLHRVRSSKLAEITKCFRVVRKRIRLLPLGCSHLDSYHHHTARVEFGFASDVCSPNIPNANLFSSFYPQWRQAHANQAGAREILASAAGPRFTFPSMFTLYVLQTESKQLCQQASCLQRGLWSTQLSPYKLFCCWPWPLTSEAPHEHTGFLRRSLRHCAIFVFSLVFTVLNPRLGEQELDKIFISVALGGFRRRPMAAAVLSLTEMCCLALNAHRGQD